MIELKDICVKYDNFELNCSITINNGSITGLVGENGSGKTTIFKAILGIIKLNSGDVFINEKNIKDFSSKDREVFGVTLADSFFSNRFTIKNIAELLEGFYISFDKEYFLNCCEKMKLPLNKNIKEFSTGMLAKLKVISTLSSNAKVLILDEPTIGIDVGTRLEILDALHEYMEKNEDTSILISSHISSDLEKICDDIYFIDNGNIILHEETNVLLDEYGVIKLSSGNKEIDESYCSHKIKTNYGYDLLTSQRQFYLENYPNLIIDKPTIDEIIIIIMGGEVL